MNPIKNSKQFTKKILLVSAAVFLLGLASHASAQGFVPLAPIPGLTEGGAADSKNLADFFNNLYKYLIGLAAVLAIIEIIWGGLEISTQDSVSKQQDGKERIRQAIFGLVLVLSPVLVFSIINPSILNLSLNLESLDLVTPQYKGAAPQITKAVSSAGKAFDLYTCDPVTGNCNAALTKCGSAGGTSDQDYCVDPTQDNKIISNGKLFFGAFRSGNGCDTGLVPAIRCDSKK